MLAGIGGPLPTSCSATTALYAVSRWISDRQVNPLSEPCMLYVANDDVPSLFTACAAEVLSVNVVARTTGPARKATTAAIQRRRRSRVLGLLYLGSGNRRGAAVRRRVTAVIASINGMKGPSGQ